MKVIMWKFRIMLESFDKNPFFETGVLDISYFYLLFTGVDLTIPW